MTDSKIHNRAGNISLGTMVENQDVENLSKYLKELNPKSKDPADVNSFQEMIDKLLWHSTTFKSGEVVQLLIDKGGNLNYIKNGKKGIHNAIANDNEDVIAVLVKNKVDINEQDTQGNTGFMLLFDNEDLELKGEWGQKPAKNELTEQVLKTAQKLLDMNANVDINAKNLAGKTSLHYAAYHGNEYLVKFLTDNHADPTIETITDNCIASEYVAEENESLFNFLEDYRTEKFSNSKKPKF